MLPHNAAHHRLTVACTALATVRSSCAVASAYKNYSYVLQDLRHHFYAIDPAIPRHHAVHMFAPSFRGE